MKRPSDLNDYSQCVRVLTDRTLIFCVECDGWHSVGLIAMARVEIGFTGIKELDLEDESIRFCCSVCGADVGYLLRDQRLEIEKLLEAA